MGPFAGMSLNRARAVSTADALGLEPGVRSPGTGWAALWRPLSSSVDAAPHVFTGSSLYVSQPSSPLLTRTPVRLDQGPRGTSGSLRLPFKGPSQTQSLYEVLGVRVSHCVGHSQPITQPNRKVLMIYSVMIFLLLWDHGDESQQRFLEHPADSTVCCQCSE